MLRSSYGSAVHIGAEPRIASEINLLTGLKGMALLLCWRLLGVDQINDRSWICIRISSLGKCPFRIARPGRINFIVAGVRSVTLELLDGNNRSYGGAADHGNFVGFRF